MDIEEALTAHMKAQAGLMALTGDRFEFDGLPDNTAMPYFYVKQISPGLVHTLAGKSSTEHPVYQFTAVANKRSEVKAVAAQIKAALSDYHGTMSGVEIKYIGMINELYSTLTNNDGTQRRRIADLEFEIFYKKE